MGLLLYFAPCVQWGHGNRSETPRKRRKGENHAPVPLESGNAVRSRLYLRAEQNNSRRASAGDQESHENLLRAPKKFYERDREEARQRGENIEEAHARMAARAGIPAPLAGTEAPDFSRSDQTRRYH